MVANGYSKQIRERIDSAADGTIFVNSDFVDVTDPETVRRNLNRLTQAGILRRILQRIQMQLQRHWLEAITGPLLHAEIQPLTYWAYPHR